MDSRVFRRNWTAHCLNRELAINLKKSTSTKVDSAFLKSGARLHELTVPLAENEQINIELGLKVKPEVDIIPSGGFSKEEKLLLRPISCFIKCDSLTDLFAGKMRALLFRKRETRAKGKNWYDYEW